MVNLVKFGFAMSVLKFFATVPGLSNLNYNEKGLVFYYPYDTEKVGGH